ncbi:MAG TPA: hypothetical protein PKM25_18415 [Candidatus Ozemobacteraceae bacterium]|nr:hypothetical protein [Candidatus Ozemobacteraceae bacterium]
MPTTALKCLGKIAALAMMFTGSCLSSANAVTPDVSLPAWHTLEVQVSEWNPPTGEVSIDADLRGTGMRLSDLSAELHWPKPIESRSSRQEAALLAAGQSWKTRYAGTGVKPPFDGWVELEVHARPDQAVLRKNVERISTYTPLMRRIMIGEVEAVKAPLAVGRSLPLYIDKDIAVLMPRALVFTPVLKMGGRSLHLWMPECSSDGPVAKALSGLRTSLGTEPSPRMLDEAIKAVDEAMTAASDSVGIRCEGGNPPFSVPLNVFRDAMTMNRAVLAAAREPGSAIAMGRIERLVRQAHPNFTTAFGWANVGVLQAEAGLTPRACESFREALNQIPAWPLVRGWLTGLEKGK